MQSLGSEVLQFTKVPNISKAMRKKSLAFNLNLTNLFQQQIGFIECNDHFVIMRNVIKFQLLLFSVLETFLRVLINTDIKVEVGF